MSEPEVRRMLREYGFTIGNLSYRLDRDANYVEYQMTIRTRQSDNVKRFFDALGKLDAVKELRFVPTGD
jgi:putative Mg2+ transporter-C (MgtC) family protein